jgi:hypothetical protein
MTMILISADGNRQHTLLFRDTTDVLPQSFLNFGRQDLLAAFRAEYKMNMIGNVTMSHGTKIQWDCTDGINL